MDTITSAEPPFTEVKSLNQFLSNFLTSRYRQMKTDSRTATRCNYAFEDSGCEAHYDWRRIKEQKGTSLPIPECLISMTANLPGGDEKMVLSWILTDQQVFDSCMETVRWMEWFLEQADKIVADATVFRQAMDDGTTESKDAKSSLMSIIDGLLHVTDMAFTRSLFVWIDSDERHLSDIDRREYVKEHGKTLFEAGILPSLIETYFEAEGREFNESGDIVKRVRYILFT